MKPNLLLEDIKKRHIENMNILNQNRKNNLINFIFWLILITIILFAIIICYDKYKNKNNKKK